MVIDYSKWDNIDDASDDESPAPAKPKPKKKANAPPKGPSKKFQETMKKISKEKQEEIAKSSAGTGAMKHAIEAQKQKIRDLEAQLKAENEKLAKMLKMVGAVPGAGATKTSAPARDLAVSDPEPMAPKPKPATTKPRYTTAASSPSTQETELVGDQLKQEKRLETRLNHLRETLGLEHSDTLDCFFELFDVWIGLYRLNKCSTLLKEVLPICRKKGDPYELKAVQATAFTLWKQSRFSEALELFHEMENIVGLSPALCENIGHTYNSMGDYAKADEYFTKAKEQIQLGGGNGNLGGVLLGLGLVKERLQREEEALPILQEALEIYQNQFRHREASLVAKAHMSVGGCLVKLKSPEAEHHFREAIRIFKITCGNDSPLTSNAMQKLAAFLVSANRHKEAHPYVLESLKIEGTKDAFNLTTCCELLQISRTINSSANTSIGTSNHMKTINSYYRPYVNLIKVVNARIEKEKTEERDRATVAVWYKWGGEHCAVAKSNNIAIHMLERAVVLFEDVKEVDCSKLMLECEQILKVVREKAGVSI